MLKMKRSKTCEIKIKIEWKIRARLLMNEKIKGRKKTISFQKQKKTNFIWINNTAKSTIANLLINYKTISSSWRSFVNAFREVHLLVCELSLKLTKSTFEDTEGWDFTQWTSWYRWGFLNAVSVSYSSTRRLHTEMMKTKVKCEGESETFFHGKTNNNDQSGVRTQVTF